MKVQLILLTLLAAVLAGCTDDTPDTDPAPVLEPVPAGHSFASVQPASVTGLEPIAQLEYADGGAFPSGSGIWVHGDIVYGSALGNGFFIADISDPMAPKMLFNATVDAATEAGNTATSFARDADVIAHPDGRMTLVLATQTNGMHLWNVTDPRQPELASIVADIGANHNVAVIPGTELVFNSQSGGLGRTNEIIDARDPYNAYVISEYGTHGCHDIAFHGRIADDGHGHAHDKFRAYCAGIDRTEIWSLDAFDPMTATGIELVGVVEFGPDSPVIGNPLFDSYPIRTLHHLAMVNEDASVLIIGDEQNGGGTPGACYTPDGAPVTTPFGALWFYDLSDETAPSLKSWISAPLILPALPGGAPDPSTIDPTDPNSVLNVLRPVTNGVPNCTAHFGTLVPGEEKLVMAWYSAGVLLIDFSDIDAPVVLDQFQPETGTNPWDARIHGGYVFTGDIVRGMDVLKLV